LLILARRFCGQRLVINGEHRLFLWQAIDSSLPRTSQTDQSTRQKRAFPEAHEAAL
jgi:hypothetical protein